MAKYKISFEMPAKTRDLIGALALKMDCDHGEVFRRAIAILQVSVDARSCGLEVGAYKPENKDAIERSFRWFD